MPNQKHQHYVPVFYLKRFSSDESKRMLSLFNLKSSRFIHGASVKDQAYKDNFYGWEREIENSLKVVEDRAGELLSEIIKKDTQPRWRSKEHHILLVFTYVSLFRTLQTAEILNELVDKTVKKTIFSERRLNFHKSPYNKEDLEKVQIGLSNAPQVLFGKILQALPLAEDLLFKLIINNTPTPFISSDNPVVLYNQFFETREIFGSSTGIDMKGLQIFFPISPKHLILFYDKDVYKVHGFMPQPVSLNNPSDIDFLNGLQYLNAHSNLYFNGSIADFYIKGLVERFSTFRRKTKGHVKEFYQGLTPEGQHHSLVATYREDIKCRLLLSFIVLTKEAKKFKTDGHATYYRNEFRSFLHGQFCKLVEQKIYEPHQFDQFLLDMRKLADRSRVSRQEME
jgi:hypothetical protein